MDTVRSLDPPTCALYAHITVDGAAVRWRDDGTDPTAAIGQLIPDGGELWYHGDLNTIRFLEAAASATISVSFYALNDNCDSRSSVELPS